MDSNSGMKFAFRICVVLWSLAFAQAEVSGMSLVGKTFDQCNKDPDFVSCLKVKAVKLIDRAMVVDKLPVNDYMTIGRDPGSSVTPLGETGVPRDPQALNSLLVDRVSRYLSTRVVHLNVPKEKVQDNGESISFSVPLRLLLRLGLQNSIMETLKPDPKQKGRKKKKGGLGLAVLGGAWAILLLKLAITGIALIAGKALLIGKIALMLAGILGLRGLVSKDDQHPAQVIYAEPEVTQHGGWGRTGVVTESANELAYKGQRSMSS